MDSTTPSRSSLQKKITLLQEENEQLRRENTSLKKELRISDPASEKQKEDKPKPSSSFNKFRPSDEKIELYLSLFRGRKEVFAKRWENKKGKSGYSPVCHNEWNPGICKKPQIKCSVCSHQHFQPYDKKAVESHLRGALTAGIYPLLPDNSCYFLAMDFDKQHWQQDVLAVAAVCRDSNIPFAIERSRSGNGAHLWFFFDEKTEAATARKLGTVLLTTAMEQRHEISFTSYDRFFPNQNILPKGGFGNLIALPLQKTARQHDNSVFIDENLQTYSDQWSFLDSIKKIPKDNLHLFIKKLHKGNELGALKEDQETKQPWIRRPQKTTLLAKDFPQEITIVRADQLYIPKKRISQKGMNALKRLAAFSNPQFYKAQAMRLPVYNTPRIISCAQETPSYLCLPIGCEEDLSQILDKNKVKTRYSDKRNKGKHIHATFNGKLRPEQEQAVKQLLRYKNGIVVAPPAFGKTVMAAYIIAQRKTNTLIVVHRKQLLSQWIERLASFLQLTKDEIGQFGGGKHHLTGSIDLAIMQSLNRKGEVKELVRNYGMVFIDECHHIPAFSFEQILRQVTTQYVYGLTATPTRKDGHHPIIFMCCGPIRHQVAIRKQAAKRPFEHFIIPRFTGFLVTKDPRSTANNDWPIQELYHKMTHDDMRNQFIVDDVIKNHKKGRNALILTERTAHVKILAQQLQEKIPHVIALTGGQTVKESKRIFHQIDQMSANECLTLVATGKYIGEGFDEARLDTLFLAMPISWKGTLQQYTGRLHRLYEGKKEVLVYDYVDIHVKMLEKMYAKRLSGYAGIGYKVKGGDLKNETADIIFDKDNFLPVYSQDLLNATKEILIVSPFVSKRRVERMLPLLTESRNKETKITLVTRPAEGFKNPTIPSVVFKELKQKGIKLVFQSKIHQKFAIIDQRIAWYGSINLMSYGSAQESMMRIESGHIANELIRSIIKR